MKRTYIKFRCSIYEKKLLKKRAERAGISLSEYCRSSAFGNSVIERLTEEQLASEVETLAEEIRKHLYNFKRTKK